jgi:hypothetical protein
MATGNRNTDREPRDTMKHVLPYIRRPTYIRYESPKSKFEFEQEEVVKKTIEKTETAADGKVTKVKVTEESRQMRKKTVELKEYGKTVREDVEHFFTAFETMQSAMQPEWDSIRKSKANNAQVLFDAMDHLLVGTAQTEWKDVLATSNDRTWETFKKIVSQFITTKLLPADAYNIQLQYLMERRKPLEMTMQDWWLRFQTLNRLMRYFFKDQAEFQRHYLDKNFSDWWFTGGLGKMEIQRVIINKAPNIYHNRLEEVDVDYKFQQTAEPQDLIDYFIRLEHLEERRRQPARRMTRNTRIPQGRGPGGQYRNQFNYPVRVSPGGSAASLGGPVYRAWSQDRPTYYQSNQSNSGGRRVMARANVGGRAGRMTSGGGRNNSTDAQQRSQFQPRSRSGELQRTQGRGAVQQQAFYQSSSPDQVTVADEGLVETENLEESEVDEGNFANFSQDELCDQWNESLYMEDDFVYEEEQEEFFGIEEDDGEEDHQCF